MFDRFGLIFWLLAIMTLFQIGKCVREVIYVVRKEKQWQDLLDTLDQE
jgi:predicted Rossmann-fold nucleotide-binding protein